MHLVFPFEMDEIGPDLDLVPLAARRALDHAGVHLPLEGWRSLPIDLRQRIVQLGADEDVDVTVVATIAAQAVPSARLVEPVSDPSPRRLPDGLSADVGVDEQLWASLGGLGRFALAHVARRAEKRGDPAILATAIDAFTSRSTMPSPDLKRIASEPPQLSTQLSTHIGPTGDVRMVDVADKPATRRVAVATARVRMREETIDRLSRGDTPKGEVLATARIAGIMAAKRTPDIIPMCHGIALSHVEVKIEIDKPASLVRITARAEAMDRTGVEMEAMVAASIAALTMYDMLKGIDREMVVEEVLLVEKSGGRSGHFRRST
jgi:cyclic pyranopterin phosphate synthase